MRLDLPLGALEGLSAIEWNASRPALVEEAIVRGEGKLAPGGALVAMTTPYTGRSPQDKYIVADHETTDRIWWGSKQAHRMTPAAFDALLARQKAHLAGKRVHVRDVVAGADPAHGLRVRVVTETAWHSLFVDNMFLPAQGPTGPGFRAGLTIVHTPSFHADPARDGTRTEVFIALDFVRRMVLIGGTKYAGEIKKSVFSALNYYLPLVGVMGMHCSANVGPGGDSALFFGLSGTGKTTLSAEASRPLVGDDEHGWTDAGIFNFEGGCYAKAIRLSPDAEPEIYATTSRFGTILENVVMDDTTRRIDFDDGSVTENTRVSYPLASLANFVADGRAGHPKNVVMLTCDAYGVLPPIARLTHDQAMYHFISGYTARVAGTERGVTEPKATFSACFGAPFMPLHPGVYAKLLGAKLDRHGSHCWLLNTGWSGGGHGQGKRMPIAWSRALLRAAIDGRLADVPLRVDPIFGFHVPTACPGVPTEALDPRSTWRDPAAYDDQAMRLAEMFQQNFRTFEEGTAQRVCQAGPRVAQTS